MQQQREYPLVNPPPPPPAGAGAEGGAVELVGEISRQTLLVVGPPPEPVIIKCPRCSSMKTKFCYYNNYNLSQPRHFCKNCRRYWTKGGALRNVPIGGGTRTRTKTRTRKNSTSSVTGTTSAVTTTTSVDDDDILPLSLFYPNPGGPSAVVDDDHKKMQLLDFSGSFSSLLEFPDHDDDTTISTTYSS